MSRLVALYPRSWRDRYEDEFLSLIEDRPPDALDRVDIIRGAIDARLHPRDDPGSERQSADPLPYNGPWSVRRAGAVALVGGLLFLIALAIALNGPLVEDPGGSYRDGAAALPFFFVALCLLDVGIWAAAATLPSSARVARTATVIGGISGLLWGAGPWNLWFGVVLFAGVAILAIEAARLGRWRSLDAVAVVGGSAAAWGMVFLTVVPRTDLIGETDVMVVAFALLSLVWFGTAHALLRPAVPIADPSTATRQA